MDSPDDARRAFDQLPALVEPLHELQREWYAVAPSAETNVLVAEMWDAGLYSIGLPRLAQRLSIMAGYPDLSADLEPRSPSGNVAASYWHNRNGLTQLRRERRSSGASRGRLRTLAVHVDEVLFPALQADWSQLGADFDAVRSQIEWGIADRLARSTTTAPLRSSTSKGPPSWH